MLAVTVIQKAMADPNVWRNGSDMLLSEKSELHNCVFSMIPLCKKKKGREMKKENGIKILWRMSVFVQAKKGCEGHQPPP